MAVVLSGCGKTVQRTATEQLILSDAVDRAVRSINFAPLGGFDCYIDTSYLKPEKAPPVPNNDKVTQVVNPDYVISSVRNQLLAAGCRIVAKREEARFIIEPRIGALGADMYEVMYGVPSTNALSVAASAVPATPSVPIIPEIAVARRNDNTAAAKIAVFAYDASTGLPVWQSGMSLARSDARDTWLFGIGPFHSGAIYEKPRFKAMSLNSRLIGDHDNDMHRQSVSMDEEFVFSERLEQERVAEAKRMMEKEKAKPPIATGDKPTATK